MSIEEAMKCSNDRLREGEQAEIYEGIRNGDSEVSAIFAFLDRCASGDGNSTEGRLATILRALLLIQMQQRLEAGMPTDNQARDLRNIVRDALEFKSHLPDVPVKRRSKPFIDDDQGKMQDEPKTGPQTLTDGQSDVSVAQDDGSEL